MYKIEIEKADGEVYLFNDGKEYEKGFAEAFVEYMWNVKGHTGEYASFRMIDSDGEVHTEFEC